MGKIRVKTLGIEEVEEKEKKEARLAGEEKRARKKTEIKKLVKGAKGGERVVAVGPSEEELAQLEVPKVEEVSKVSKGEKKQKKTRGIARRIRSKDYQTAAKLVDKNKTYGVLEALKLLMELKRAKFDETVELHINTIEKGITANITLPHGTGKKIRVAIADDKIIEDVGKGKIDFEVLLADPSMMPKLARVAKYLGPRGLMPNPKSGTITPNPKELAKKYEKGQITIKTEAKSPIIHLYVGKLSFGREKLEENIKTILGAVTAEKIKNVTLKSTMSPGIKVKLN